MERWNRKVAAVTGASSGIGAAIAVSLAKSGLIVIGLSRRSEIVEQLKTEVIGGSGQLHAYKCDVTCEESVKHAFDWIERTFGGVNILVNNAGITFHTLILGDSDNIDNLKKIIDTNLLGSIMCTKQVFNILQKTQDIGHIINISSIMGHSVPFVSGLLAAFNIYAGTKYAVRATSEVLRQELIHLNKNVKISQVSPGIVETNILEAAAFPHSKQIFDSVPTLNANDVAEAVLYIIATPPHAQIHDIIIKAVGEQF